MLREGLVKPCVEQMVQAQSIIGVSAGIAHCFRVMGRKFVEEPTIGNFLEGWQFIANQFRHQLFKAAVRKPTEFKRRLERHLCGCDGVIAGRLDNDAQRIQEHGFKSQIVRHLDDYRIHPQLIPQIVDNFGSIRIAAVKMLKRHINAGSFLNRQRHTYDAGAMGVQ